MAKKKRAKKKAVDPMETIHFRPGPELGALIGQLADKLTISRGEAAKRLVSLAIRGLDIGFYEFANEYTEYLYGSGGFDEACHHLHVAVQDDADDPHQEVIDIERDKKLNAVRIHLERYRALKSFEEEAQKKRVSIKIHRTNG